MDMTDNTMCFKTWYDLTIDIPEKYFYWCCKTIRTKEQIDPTRFNSENLTLDYIINNPVIRKRKRELLSGVRSIECKDCWDNEDSSGSSFRKLYHRNNNTHSLSDFDNKDLLNTDLTRKIELVLTNRCNSACVYCWEGLSSRWQKETGKKFPDTDDKTFDKVIEVLHEYWNAELHNKKRINFSLLGGEPFFTNHMYSFIENFINKIDVKNTQQLTIDITTNLNFTDKVFNKFLHLVKQNDKINYNLIVSIEATEDKFEYIRWGTDWDNWSRNFDLVIDNIHNTGNLNLSIGSAHNSLSLPYIVDFLKFIENKNIKSPVKMISNWVDFPYPLSINMIDKRHVSVIDDAIEYIDTMKTKILSKNHYINGLRAMKDMINRDISSEELDNSEKFFSVLENRRNVSYSTVFPHFSELIKDDK